MKSFRNFVVLASALAFGLGLAGAASAQVTGTTVHTTLISRGHGGAASITGPGPTFFITPFTPPPAPPPPNPIPIGSCTVAPTCGDTYTFTNGQEFSWQVTANQIIVTALTAFDWGSTTSDGVAFAFAPDPNITNVTIDGSTTAPVVAGNIAFFNHNYVALLFDPEVWSVGQKGVFDLSFNNGPYVPEPATWLMMLLGFGGIGAVIRRRNRALKPAV